MILIWLIFRALTLSQEPYVFSHPHHNNTKGPISDPELRYGFFLGPSFLRVWAPRPHACDAAPETHNSEQTRNLAPPAAVAFSILEYGRQ